MVRARLATLTLASGLLLTSAGCMNLGDRFHAWRQNLSGQNTVDCTCQDAGGFAATPTSMESGPVLVSPGVMPGAMPGVMPGMMPPPPPPGTNPQVGPPPRIITTPATATPWSGH